MLMEVVTSVRLVMRCRHQATQLGAMLHALRDVILRMMAAISSPESAPSASISSLLTVSTISVSRALSRIVPLVQQLINAQSATQTSSLTRPSSTPPANRHQPPNVHAQAALKPIVIVLLPVSAQKPVRPTTLRLETALATVTSKTASAVMTPKIPSVPNVSSSTS